MERQFDLHIGYYIQEIARALTRVHNEMLSRHGISFAQFRVLNCLWEEDGLNQSDIAEILHIKPSSLSTLVTLLEKKDLIERRIGETDSRSRTIHLTESGASLKMVSWDIIMALESVLSQPFSETEKALMLEWLKKILGTILKEEEIHQG